MASDQYVFRRNPPAGMEHPQPDPLQRRAVATSLDGHLHVHRVPAGRDRLVPRQRRPDGEQPLVGDQSSSPTGADLADHGNRASCRPRMHDRHAGHLQRRVVESQVEHHPARREQDDSERGSENLAHPDAPIGRCRGAAAPNPRSRRLNRCGVNSGTVSDQILRRRYRSRPNRHTRRRHTRQCGLRHRLGRCSRTFRQSEPGVGGGIRRQSDGIIELEPADRFVFRQSEPSVGG